MGNTMPPRDPDEDEEEEDEEDEEEEDSADEPPVVREPMLVLCVSILSAVVWLA